MLYLRLCLGLCFDLSLGLGLGLCLNLNLGLRLGLCLYLDLRLGLELCLRLCFNLSLGLCYLLLCLYYLDSYLAVKICIDILDLMAGGKVLNKALKLGIGYGNRAARLFYFNLLKGLNCLLGLHTEVAGKLTDLHALFFCCHTFTVSFRKV